MRVDRRVSIEVAKSTTSDVNAIPLFLLKVEVKSRTQAPHFSLLFSVLLLFSSTKRLVGYMHPSLSLNFFQMLWFLNGYFRQKAQA